MMRNHPSFNANMAASSDIQEHLGLLRGLAMQCEQVVELGFRTGVSTSAFLSSGVKVRSYDIEAYPCKPFVRKLAAEYPDTFEFKVGDSRKVEIPECEMLFVDTDHTYATTFAELCLHEMMVSQWIVLHDTVSFGRKDRKPGKGDGVLTAVEHFLLEPGRYWQMLLHLPNNNGLTILQRKTE